MRLALIAMLIPSVSASNCQVSPECTSPFDQEIIAGWAVDTASNVDFIIRDDEFYDFEHLYSYSYRLCGDTLSVIDSIHTVSSYVILELSKDSLVLEHQDGSVDRYVRR